MPLSFRPAEGLTGKAAILALGLEFLAGSGCVKAPEDQPQLVDEDKPEEIVADNQTCIESSEVENYVNAYIEFNFPKNHDGVPIDNEGQHLMNMDGTPVALDGKYPLQVSEVDGHYVILVPKGALPVNYTSYKAYIASTDTLAEEVLEGSPNLDCVTPTEENRTELIWSDTETEDGLHIRLGMDDDSRCEAACNELNGDESGENDQGETDTTTPDMGNEEPVCTKLVYNGPDRIMGDEWNGVNIEPNKAVEYGQLLACFDDKIVCTTPFDLTKAELTILPHDYNTVDLNNDQQPDEPVIPGGITLGEMNVDVYNLVVEGMLNPDVNATLEPALEIDVAITSSECGPIIDTGNPPLIEDLDPEIPTVHLTLVPYRVEGDPLAEATPKIETN